MSPNTQLKDKTMKNTQNITGTEMRRLHVEDALNLVNPMGLTIKELARAGRIGNPAETAKQLQGHYQGRWLDVKNIKETVRLNKLFIKLATVAIQSIIDANR